MVARAQTKVDPAEYGRGVVMMVRAQTAEYGLVGAMKVTVMTGEHDLEAEMKATAPMERENGAGWKELKG